MKDRSAAKPVPAGRKQPAARKKRAAGRSRNAGTVRQTLARYRRLLDSTSDAVYVLDRRLRFTLANRAGLRFLGRTGNNVEGKRITDLFPRASGTGAFAEILAALEKRASTKISALFDFGGRKGWFEASLDPVPEGWVCVLRDISETKRDAQALIESESRFRSLFETTQDSIFIIDRDTLDILSVNPAACRLYGYTAEEFQKMKNVDVSAEPGKTETAVRMGATAVPIHYHRKKDGTVFPVEMTGGYFEQNGRRLHTAFIRDCSERLRAERALVESEDKFRYVFENSIVPKTITLVSGELHVNRAFCEILGYTAEELRNKTWREISHTDDIEPTQQALDRLRSGETDSARLVKRYLRRDGSIVWAEVSTTLRRNPDGTPQYFMTSLNDVTERRRLEEALEKDRRELQLIIDSSPVIIFYKDRAGRFVRVNRALAEALRFRASDFVGKTVFDLYSPDIARGMTADDREVFETGKAKLNIVEQYESADGLRWVRTEKAPIFDERGEVSGLIGFAQDITDWKAAEDALRASEKRFRALIENSSDAISLVNPDATVLYNSPSYSRLMGYRAEDRVGKNAMELIHPEDAPVVARLFREIIEKPGRIDLPPLRVRHADGSWRWIEGVAQNLLADPNVKAVVVNFRDITERRKAEEALRQSEARFRDLAELLPQTVYEMDLEGKLLYINRSGLEASGYGEDDIRRGFNILTAVLPQDRDRLRDTVERILRGEKISGTAYTAIRKDGSTYSVLAYSVPIVVDGRPRGLRGLVVDVSGQKKLEKELAETRAILETAFRETPIPMVLVTAPDNVFRMANRAALELLGVENEPSHLGEPLAGFEPSWESFDPQGNPVPFSAMPLPRALRGETTENELYHIRRKDGTVRWALTSASPVRDSAGAIIAAFSVFPDVTERISTEEELKKQLRVEQLATEISADFVNVAYDQIDAAIRLALKKTTLYAGARLGSLFMVTPDGSTVTNTHEWCVALEDSQVGQGPRLPFGIREFHLAALSRNRAVSIGRPTDYPADEEGEREMATKYGFRPFVLAPLFRGGELIGVVGVYGETGREIEWPAQLVTLLGLIGDMIVNLLDRKQAEAELHLYREHLEELVAQRTEELERSRAAAIKLMETATAQRQRAEEALRDSNRMAEALSESQTMLRLATRSAQIGIVETDLASGELIWDATCANIHGLPADATVTLDRYFDEIVAPEDRAPVRASLEKALAAAGGHWGREYRIVRPGGERRWITEDYVIIRGHDGAAVRLIGAKQDVTVRKEAEAELRRTLGEKETLLREIHHRVKNNLNTISNLIYFQTKLLKDKQAVAAFRDSQNRIQSMARIHEHLYRSWDLARVDMKAYLSDLVVDLSQTYGVQTTKLDLTVAALALDIDQAVPCGLIMNELVSNAMKYAFDKTRKNNKIAVSLAPEGDRIVLEVADNGLGLPSNWDIDSVNSLGIRLVNMFCKQLAGELGVKSAPGAGTSFHVSFGRAREGAAQ